MKSQYPKNPQSGIRNDCKEYLDNYEGLRQISKKTVKEIKSVPKVPKSQNHTLFLDESEDVECSMSFYLRKSFIPSSED